MDTQDDTEKSSYKSKTILSILLTTALLLASALLQPVIAQSNARPTIVSPNADSDILVQEGRAKAIVVVVADDNRNDGLTLSLKDLDPEEKSVTIPAPQVVLPNGNVTRTTILTIKGLKAGPLSLQMTVEDNSGSTVDDTSSIVLFGSVTANSRPTISSLPTGKYTLQFGGEAQKLSVVLGDEDDDDTNSLSARVVSSKETVASVTIESTMESTRQITITPHNIGTATISVTVSDGRGIENSSTVTQQFIVSVNAPPIIAEIAPLSTMEGSLVTVDTVGKVSDPNGDELSYAWHWLMRDRPSNALVGQTTDEAALTFTVPTDWVLSAESNQSTLTLQLTVSDATLSTTAVLSLVVAKTNNGPLVLAAAPTLRGMTLTAPTLVLTNDPDSNTRIPGSILSYQWQFCPKDASDGCVANSSNWKPSGTNTAVYAVPDSTTIGDRFRVAVTYKDGQGYTKTVTSRSLVFGAIRIRLKVFLEGALE